MPCITTPCPTLACLVSFLKASLTRPSRARIPQPQHGQRAPAGGATLTDAGANNQNSLLPKMPVYYRVCQFITEHEIRFFQGLKRTELVLFCPYNQGTYGRGSGVALRPLTV